MWELLMGLLIGEVVGKSRVGRFVRPALKLFAIGILIASLIYTCVVLNAVRERSRDTHVHTHSIH
jgi:hypothetical protein